MATTPIFVLGSGRNGTTWLSNVLCRHDGIAGVQHEAHHGFHESKIWQHQAYWGDLREETTFISFIEQYSAGDYFRLAKGNKEHLYRHRPRDFVSFFFRLMDEFANKEDAACWVTKIDPLLYHRRNEFEAFIERAKERYDDCKFVSIRRDSIDVLQSYLSMQGVASQGRERPFVSQGGAVLCIARNVAQYREIERVISREKGLALSFEAFKNEHTAAVQRLMSYVGLPPEGLTGKAYRANSSFALKEKHQHHLNIHLAKRVLLPLFNRFPGLAKAVLGLREAARRPSCPLSWRLLKMEYMRASLEEELLQSGDVSLHSILFSGSLPNEDRFRS